MAVGIRELAARIRRLERAVSPVSPIVQWFGSFDAFKAEVQASIDAGHLDPEIAVVVRSFEAWETTDVWRG